MKKIASFCINHDTLLPGLYLSRADFGDIETYDLRFRRPNCGNYLSSAAAHTMEHLFATFIRSGELGEQVVYFGPMGCLTGFYLILKGTPRRRAIAEVQKGMSFVRDYEGEIPGSRPAECGNCCMHDLAGAKREAKAYGEVIALWSEGDLIYPQ